MLAVVRCWILISLLLIPLAARPQSRTQHREPPCPTPEANAPAVNPPTLVADAQSAALGFRCDGGGTLAGGNCVVGGLHIDRDCARWNPAQLTEVAAAIQDVRGAHGVGCVSAINPGLGTALRSAMSRNPPVDFCCDQCNGRPDTSVSQIQCASTIRPDATHPSTAVVFSSSVLGTGICGSQRYEQPLRGALLHELTHTSGVPGVNEHDPAGVPDPEALHPEGQFRLPSSQASSPLQMIDQRNFVPDPVYGCQNSCYGRAPLRNAMNCVACATAVADPAYAAREGAPAGENSNSDVLATRVFQLESRMAGQAGAGSAPPAACQTLWNRANDPGRHHYQASAAARAIQTNGLVLEHCAPGIARSSQSLSDYVAPCAQAATAVKDACARFAAPEASGCQATSPSEPVPFHSEEIVNTCRVVLRQFQDNVLRVMNSRRAIPQLAGQFAAIHCEDYFAPARLCPSLDPNARPEHVLADCQRAMPGSTP